MRLYNYKETPAAVENIFHKTGTNAFAASVASAQAEAELASAARLARAAAGGEDEDASLDSDSKMSESKAESKGEFKMDAKLDAKSSLSAGNSIADAPTVTSSRNGGAGVGRWPLMTRAHLAQALLCAAVSSKLGDSPSQALVSFISGPLQTFWTDITSNYLFYTTMDPMLKATVSMKRSSMSVLNLDSVASLIVHSISAFTLLRNPSFSLTCWHFIPYRL